MQINLPTGLRGDSETPKQRETLINCYFERGQVGTLSPRPGILDSEEDRYGFCRGQGVYQDSLYAVEADQLWKIDIDGNGVITRTQITGTIEGSANCILIQSFTTLLIQVIGGKAYGFDGTTLTEVTNPNYQPAVSVTFLLSRFVWVPADGGPFFWSDGNDPNVIDAANFADAEEQPDKNYAAIALKDSLIVFGGETIERQTYNSNAATFLRSQGATLNIGYVGGLVRYGETLMYIGRPVNGTFSIYMYGNPEPVSNKSVDEILNLYTFEELNTAKADFFSWKGETMVVWHLPNHTLHFYGDFAIIKSNINGNITGTWRGQFITSFGGKLVVGDRDSNKMGFLAELFTDYGEKLEAECESFVRMPPRTNQFFKRFFGTMTTGATNQDRQIELSITEDGVHYGDSVAHKFKGVGIYNEEVSWGPIGRFDNFMGFKLRWVGDIKVPIDGLFYE